MTNFFLSLMHFELQLHIPPYGASVHFELYRCGGDYFIQLFYRKNGSEDVRPTEIPNCGTNCPLDKFHELYSDILPTKSESFESLCRL